MPVPPCDPSELNAYALYRVDGCDRVEFCCCNRVYKKLFDTPGNASPGDPARRKEAEARLYRDVLRCADRQNSLQYVQKHFDRELPSFLEITLTPLSHPTGSYVFVKSSALQDLSENYQQQYHADLYMNTLLNGGCEAILTLSASGAGANPDFKICGFNQAFADFTGHTLESCAGRSVGEVLKEGNVRALNSVIGESLRLRNASHAMIPLTLDGRQYYWSVNAVPLYLECGITVTLFMNNVTDDVLERREMAELSYGYDCFFSSSAYGMALAEVAGPDLLRVERYNEAFGQFYSLYRSYKGEVPFRDLISQVQAQKKPLSFQLQIDLPGENGKEAYVFYNVSVVPITKSDTVERLFITCVESTEQLKLNKRTKASLTRREKEILQMAVQGLPNKYIAHKLNITEGTVRKITSNAYKKLEIASRTELMKFYLSDKNLQMEL